MCARPYVVNLLPCLVRICQRPEEMVHETLASAMSKISPVLISFMTDTETKVPMHNYIYLINNIIYVPYDSQSDSHYFISALSIVCLLKTLLAILVANRLFHCAVNN